MKKSITSLLKGWCAALLCAGLTLPSFAAADADAAFAAQRHDLKLSLRNAPLREVVTAFTQQTGVVFSYETSLGERTLPHVDVALNGSTLDEMLASVFALIGLLCLQITCVWCKERVAVPERPKGEKLNYLHVIKEIAKNKALLGVMFFSLVGMIGASVVNGLNTYLFKDYFGNVKIMAVSGGLSVLYSLITFAITQPLADKLGKKEWCCWGAGFAAAVFALLFFFPIHNPVLFIVINGVCYLGASGMQVLIWAMVNDSIDYHELQTGERNEGIVYSTYSFFRKLASAVSGSLSSFVLGFIGYNVAEGAVQTAEVSNAIWKSYTGIYVLGYGVAVAILFFVYPLTKAKTTEMLEQLKARRAEKASAMETDGEQCP